MAPPDLSAPSPASPISERSFWDRISTRPDLNPQNNFQGQDILVVYNPEAQQGRFRNERTALQAELESLGLRVHFLETVADASDRLRLISEGSQRLFSETGRPVRILGLGGDTTVDEVMRASVQGITGPVHDITPANATAANANIRRNITSGIVANTGSAGDIAAMVNAPPHFLGLRTLLRSAFNLPPPQVFRELPAFLSTSQTLPMSITSVRGDAGDQTAFHSVNIGTGGRVFEIGEANRRANPTSLLNRGIFNYFRVLPQAIQEHGMTGWMVEIEHHGRVDRVRASDMLGTTHRIITGAAGMSGHFGEFNLIAFPRGLAGIPVLIEGMYRGLATKAGFNLVSGNSRFWTLNPRLHGGQNRQIILAPGERATVRFFDAVTNEPARVPWQVNGASVPTHVHQAEIYVPPVSIPVESDPHSLGMRLYHQDILGRGEPLYHASQGRQSATTPYYSNEVLQRVGANVQTARLPALIAQAHGVNVESDLSRIESNPLRAEELEAWRNNPENLSAVENPRLANTWRNRAATHAPGLILGGLSMYSANHLLHFAGIDADRDPFLHFAGSACASHFMNQVGNASFGVLMNRMRGLPYDFAFTESRVQNGARFTRFVYENNTSLARSMGRASMRSLGLHTRSTSLITQCAKGLVTVPFRMAWDMGPSLACSRGLDLLLGQTGMDANYRRSLVSAAFFMPTASHIFLGDRSLALGRNPFLRGVGRATSMGFIADMLFTGLHSLYYGEDAQRRRWQNHLISDAIERDEHRGFWSFHGIASFFAPELAAWWDARSDD